MLVRRLDELAPERIIEGGNWTSRRLLLRGDAMGFSLHDTLIHAGTRTHLHYVNHLEAVYCIEGEGSIEVVATGEVIPLRPGTVYALDKHDEHWLVATKTMRMVCVFNPPVVGDEVHDENGAYPVHLDNAASATR